MKLLHQKSIYESNYDEALQHDIEIDNIMSKLFSLPNFLSEFQLRFEDDYHKEMNVPLDYESYLHNIFDFIAEQDIKNGVDVHLSDEGNLCFMAYGQSYTIRSTGVSDVVRTSVTVISKDEAGNQVDFSQHFTIPVQEKEQMNKIKSEQVL
ncbi:hypothetical protein RFK58_02585 [Streptococcus suis]|uniref:hypothetical protein n=1 Tax=Streptococcus suis TaxID=1307 RepID=UPI0029903207|nr:hypothetical protein [Streptococcus suis]